MSAHLGSLGPESLPALRDALLGHIEAYSSGATGTFHRHSASVRQLAAALAALVLRWPAWEAPLADCGSRLGSSAFHEFLKILAEESQSQMQTSTAPHSLLLL